MKKSFLSIFQIRGIYLATTIFLVVLSFLVFRQIKNLIASSHWVNHSTQVSLELEKFIGILKDAETSHRGYLLTNDSAFYQSFKIGINEYPVHLKNLFQLTNDNPEQQKNIKRIEQLARHREQYMLTMLTVNNLHELEVHEMLSGKIIMDSLRVAVANMNQIENNLLLRRNLSLEKQTVLTPVLILTLSLLALGTLLLSYYRINSALVHSQYLQKEQQLMVMEAPSIICMMRGPLHVHTMANEQYLKLIGHRDNIDRPIRAVLPELEGQGFFELLDAVYATGKSYQGNEALIKLEQKNGVLTESYINFVFRASFNSKKEIEGILVYGQDVTEQVLNRKKIEEKENQLRIALEGGELGTFDFFPDTNRLVWSSKTKEFFGLPPNAEIDYETYLGALHPEDKEKSSAIVQGAILTRNKDMYEIEYRARGITDGKVKWLRSKGKATFNSAGEPIRIAGVIQDITKHKLADVILRESESRFRLLAETLAQLVWVTDEKGISEYTSHRWEEYSGIVPSGEKEWRAVVHPDDYDTINGAWADSLSSGVAYQSEVRLKSKAGEYRWHAVYGEPILNLDNQIIKWVGSFTDIHADKTFSQQLEVQVHERTIQLESKNIELEKINKELESFTYISSHDLQEPLRKIQTFATRIVEKENANLSDSGKDYFRRMQNAASRMQRLIEDLLAFSRASSGERKFETVNLNALIAEVELDLKESIIEKKATIEVAALCEVKIIPFQFHQLMHNLIGNALKFAKENIPPFISIQSKRIAQHNVPDTLLKIMPDNTLIATLEYCHICIQDNGIGFESRFNERIFEVFQRLHHKSEYAGTGIGLAIVKKICR